MDMLISTHKRLMNCVKAVGFLNGLSSLGALRKRLSKRTAREILQSRKRLMERIIGVFV